MSKALPASNYVSVTWGISPESGGLTVALLRRAGLLSQAGAGKVSVLTFDNEPNYPEIETILRQSGRIFGDVSIVNMWDWLRDQTFQRQATSKPARTDTLIPLDTNSNFESRYRGDHELSRTRYASDDLTVLQIDYFREDGSLLASDRRDTKEFGSRGGRWITLCDNSGKPYRSWRKSADFYHWVLDRMWGKTTTTYLVDSKTSANFFASYRRRNSLTVHIIQGAHLDGYTQLGVPILTNSRHRNIAELAEFDLVATLTARQRQDIVTLVGASPNLTVIPNSVPLPDPALVPLERDVTSGIMIAAFEPRKRVPLAVDAVARARKHSLVTLNIFGDGITRQDVEHAVTEHSAETFISLQGYEITALEKAKESSFFLITSESEGTPLVLLESMAAGCIPICFDIPYGPSDVITDGVSGFLIPPGDTAAMAKAILTLQNMPAENVVMMRKAAIAAVQRFNDREVMNLWATELSRAWKRKNAAWWRALKKWQRSHSERMFRRHSPEIGPPLPPKPRR